MRIALTPIALLIAAYSFAQPFERVEVVKVDSTRSAADLYRTAERWFVDTFKDAQEVIQLRDTVTHTIVGKGSMYSSAHCFGTYAVEVETRDGRYRVRVYDAAAMGYPFGHIADSTYERMKIEGVPGLGKKTYASVLDTQRACYRHFEEHMAAIPPSLKAAMVKPKDDW
jgi:hypothetical protein